MIGAQCIKNNNLFLNNLKFIASEHKIKDYENKIGFLTQEIERLRHVTEEWKGKCSKLEISITEFRVLFEKY